MEKMKQTARPIPIKAGYEIAHKYGYDQVIIIARKIGEGGTEHCTTYGVDKENCDVAGKIGNFLKYKVMQWPEEKSERRIHAEN